MKKWLNGKIVNMTDEEITAKKAEDERLSEEAKNTTPTEAERLEALEQAFMEFVGVMMNG